MSEEESTEENSDKEFYESHYPLFDEVVQEALKNGKGITEVPPEEDKKWKQYKKVKECTLWKKKVNHSKYHIFQGVQVVETKRPVGEIAQLISDISFLGSVNKEGKYGEVLKMCGKNKYPSWISNFVHQRSKSQVLLHFRMPTGSRLVYDRDFFIIREVIHEDDASYFFGKSIPENKMESERWPRFKKKCVRGEIMLFFWKIQKIDENQVRVQYVNHSSPKGWIPSGVFNSVGSSSVLACQRYCETLKTTKYFDGEDIV